MPFTRFGTYGYIHHRALNDRAALAVALRAIAAFPEVTHIFEGDVCWHFAEGRSDLYFRHPRRIFDSLDARAIDAAGPALIRVEDLAALVPADVFLAIELKIGRGRGAIERLIGLLDRDFAGRYWIDGFSLKLASLVKAMRPDLTVTLHTEYVSGGKAMVLAPDRMVPQFVPLTQMPQIDGIAVRWWGSAGRIARASADVHRAGKTLILSRLHDLEQYRLSRLWRAKAGYIHGDFAELMRHEAETFDPAGNVVENRVPPG
ncbi:MAG: hypothetical protein WDM86_13005 [Rhizomicrobium sp.]